jgi:hypothetical protein
MMNGKQQSLSSRPEFSIALAKEDEVERSIHASKPEIRDKR